MTGTLRGTQRGRTPPTLMELHRRTDTEWRETFEGSTDEAVAWIRFAAGHGFRAAQLVLGEMHLDGRRVERDPAAAHAWFTKAAAIGSVEARNMVGRCHELGWGVPVDHAEALRHYRRAAARDLAWGHYNVGCLLLYGTGVRRDHAEARRSFERAARQDHAKAMGMLGRCHEEGWGGSLDRTRAEAWYRRAAEAGDCWARFNLGLLLADAGQYAQARHWLERARETATPNCLAAIAETLAGHPDPRLQAIGMRAEALDQPPAVEPSDEGRAPWARRKAQVRALSPNPRRRRAGRCLAAIVAVTLRFGARRVGTTGTGS